MRNNWAKIKMKKYIAALGLSTILTCGTLFAMSSQSKWNNPKTELNENQNSESCVLKADRENPYNGLDEIQITNNCSDAIIVEFDYWSGERKKWIHAKYRVEAESKSVWLPAESYKNFTWDWA